MILNVKKKFNLKEKKNLTSTIIDLFGRRYRGLRFARLGRLLGLTWLARLFWCRRLFWFPFGSRGGCALFGRLWRSKVQIVDVIVRVDGRTSSSGFAHGGLLKCFLFSKMSKFCLTVA